MSRPLRVPVLGLALLLTGLALMVRPGPTSAQVERIEPGPPRTTSPETAPASPPLRVTGQRRAPLPSGQDVAVIPVRGLIYDFTLESIQHRVDQAVAEGRTTIVLELDTEGGVITAAMDIAKYLKSLPGHGITTVAWIHPKAYSAGIMLATACERIVMSTSAATGDAAPIALGQALPPTERAKVLAPWLSEFRDNARAHGYDYAPLHAMCELGIEVYEIARRDDPSRVRLVNQVDRAVMVDGMDPDEAEKQYAGPDPDLGGPSLVLGDPAESGQWIEVRRVHDGRILLTLSEAESGAIGLSSQTIDNDAALEQWLNASSLKRYPVTWSHSLAGFLTLPLVRAVLVIGLLVGAYIELQSPGLGLGGAIALVSLLALVGAPVLIGLADMWEILLVITGFVLLVIELAFTPTFGLLGAAGIAGIFIGLVLLALPSSGPGVFRGPPREVYESALVYLASLFAALVISVTLIITFMRKLGSLPFFNRMILADPEPAGPPDAYTHVAGDEVTGAGQISVGQRGVTVTPMRPGGEVEIGGRHIDAVTAGSFLDPGTAVRVIEVHANEVVVERIED